MNHLHHSVRVDRIEELGELGELEQIIATVFLPARDATGELFNALSARDRQLTVSSLRRLVAIGELARAHANRLEKP